VCSLYNDMRGSRKYATNGDSLRAIHNYCMGMYLCLQIQIVKRILSIFFVSDNPTILRFLSGFPTLENHQSSDRTGSDPGLVLMVLIQRWGGHSPAQRYSIAGHNSGTKRGQRGKAFPRWRFGLVSEMPALSITGSN